MHLRPRWFAKWKPSHPDESPSPEVTAFLNAMAPMALEFRPRAMEWDDIWARAYGIVRYPPQVSAAWLAQVANLDGVYLSMHAEPTDPTQLSLALTRAITQMAGQLQGGHLNPLMRQRYAQQVQDAEGLLKKLDAEQQALFLTGVVLLVTAPDEGTGLKRCQRLEALMAAQGMRVRVLAFRQHEGLRTAGPWGWWDDALKGRAPLQLPAETLAASFPFSHGGINHGSGIVLGRDDSRGLVLVNRWHPPAEAAITNKNMALLGPSGGGKTWTASMILMREWMLGAKVIVIDPVKRDYRRLCQALGGTWVNAAGGGAKINPLQAPAAGIAELSLEDEEASNGGLSPMMLHLQRVQTFLHTYLPELTALQQALLAQAVQEVYREHGIDWDTAPTMVSPEHWPHLGHLYSVVRRHAEADPLGHDWQMLTALLRDAGEGIAAPIWAGASTVPSQVDADFVVLDIQDLAQAPLPIRRAQFHNVLGYAWDLIRADRTERKLLVIDEAWLLVDPKTPETLSFLRSIAKLIRGYNGALVLITQQVSDFLADAVRTEGEAAVGNCAYTILFRQDNRNDLDAVTRLFQLSEKERDALQAAKVGEGLLIAGNGRVWLTVELAPHERELLERYGAPTG